MIGSAALGLLLATSARADLGYFPHRVESFDYANTTALFGQWPQTFGSGTTLNTTTTHSSANALQIPDTGTDTAVARCFFPVNEVNVAVTTWFYHDGLTFNGSGDRIDLYSVEGEHILVGVDEATKCLEFAFGSSGWTVTTQPIVNGWNRVVVTFDSSGNATLTLNGGGTLGSFTTHGFSTLLLGKINGANVTGDALFDDVTVTSTSAQSVNDCAFEYGTMVDLKGTWTVSTPAPTGTGTGPVLDTATKRSYAQSLKVPAGTTGVLSRTFYSTNATGLEVSFWFQQDPAAPGYVYLMPKATNGHYVMLRANLEGSVSYRLNSSTFNTSSAVVVGGWNEMKVEFASDGTATLRFNDTIVGTYNETGFGFASVEFGKTWDSRGNIYIDDFRCNSVFKRTYIDGFGAYSDLTSLKSVWNVSGNLDLYTSLYRSATKSVISPSGGAGSALRLNDAQWNDIGTEVAAKFYLDANAGDSYLQSDSYYGASVALKANLGTASVRVGNGAWMPVANVNILNGWNEAKFRYYNSSLAVDLLLNNSIAATFATPGYSHVEVGKDGTNGVAVIDDVTAHRNSYQGTWIRGTIRGDDGSCPPALIGIDLHNASGATVNLDGTPYTGSGYSKVLNINASGACRPTNGGMNVNDTYPCLHPELHRTAVHCETKEFAIGPIAIPTGETWTIYLEAYPKSWINGSSQTDLSTYTEAKIHTLTFTSSGLTGVPITFGMTGTSSGNGRISGHVYIHGVLAGAGQNVRAWGGPNPSDTGFNASTVTDANGAYSIYPLKTFWLEVNGGVRHNSVDYSITAPYNGVSYSADVTPQTIVPGASLTGVDIHIP